MSLMTLKKRIIRNADESIESAMVPFRRHGTVAHFDRHSLEMMINQLNQATRELNKIQVLLEAEGK